MVSMHTERDIETEKTSKIKRILAILKPDWRLVLCCLCGVFIHWIISTYEPPIDTTTHALSTWLEDADVSRLDELQEIALTLELTPTEIQEMESDYAVAAEFRFAGERQLYITHFYGELLYRFTTSVEYKENALLALFALKGWVSPDDLASRPVELSSWQYILFILEQMPEKEQQEAINEILPAVTQLMLPTEYEGFQETDATLGHNTVTTEIYMKWRQFNEK